MAKVKLGGFIGGAYKFESKNLDAQRCVNLYLVIDESGQGKDENQAMLVGCPGLRLLVDTGLIIRGLYTASNGQMYAVCGSGLYSVSTSWALTLLGNLSTAIGSVSIAENGVQMMIVDGIHGYIYTFSSNVFAQVTDLDMPQSTSIRFMDGYFIMNEVGTGRFWITSLYDGFSIDSLDFATAEGSPDNIVAIEVLRRQAWMFGTQSVQCYFDSGDVDFPISPINGVFIETGLAAANSLVKLDQTLFWLGKNQDGQGVVYMANGYQPLRISTNPIEQEIQSYADISTAVAFGYQQDGATFYVLNFDEGTWVYDLNSRMWHERAYFNGGNFERYRANFHAYFNNTHVVGDYANGKLYKLDTNYFMDDDQPRKWLRAAPHLSDSLNWLYFRQILIDMKPGVGTNTGQGIDPMLVLRMSDDGGNSFPISLSASMGKIGEFNKRVIFNKLGRSRDRIFEVSGTDPAKVVLIAAYVMVDEGSR